MQRSQSGRALFDIISYETMEAYLNQLQLGHELCLHYQWKPWICLSSSTQFVAHEMEARKPYIETGQGYTPDHKSYVSQEQIAEQIGRL